MYRMDKTAFKAQTFKEAEQSHAEYYRSLSWQERLKIASYLNSVAYNYPLDNQPKVDRTKFKAKGRK